MEVQKTHSSQNNFDKMMVLEGLQVILQSPATKLLQNSPEFYKDARNTQWLEKSFFNKWHWENLIFSWRMKLNTHVCVCLKMKSKSIKDINVRSEILKLSGKRKATWIWRCKSVLFEKNCSWPGVKVSCHQMGPGEVRNLSSKGTC